MDENITNVGEKNRQTNFVNLIMNVNCLIILNGVVIIPRSSFIDELFLFDLSLRHAIEFFQVSAICK